MSDNKHTKVSDLPSEGSNANMDAADAPRGIRDILNTYRQEIWEFDHDDKSYSLSDWNKKKSKIDAKFFTTLQNLIEKDIIGPDEATELIDDTGEEYPIEGRYERNDLRAEQRAALREAMR